MQQVFCDSHHSGVRLHPDPGRILQYLAAVRKREPAAERACADHAVRIPESDGKDDEDAGAAVCDHADRDILRPGAEIYLTCQGILSGDRRVHGRGAAAYRCGAAHGARRDDRGHVGERACEKKGGKLVKRQKAIGENHNIRFPRWLLISFVITAAITFFTSDQNGVSVHI